MVGRHTRRSGLVALALLVAVSGAVPAAVAAQVDGPAARPAARPGERPAAAPYLRADHWALDALRRLDALGLAPAAVHRALPGVDRVRAVRAFREALLAARARRPAQAPLIEGYLARFEAEYPAATGRAGATAPAGWRGGGSRVGAGYGAGDGPILTTVGTPPLEDGAIDSWEPELPAELGSRASDPLGELGLSGYWGARAAAEVAVVATGGTVRLGESHGVVRAGAATVWAGRRRLRLGYAERGIIASGSTPVDGVGLSFEPFRLPWVLGALGPVDVATSLGRLERSAPFDAPWLWLVRVAVRPHDRLGIALDRGAMAVTVDGDLSDRLRQIAFIAIGKHSEIGDENLKDNQVAAVELTYRPPAGPLPLMLYLDWGLDDSAGSWKDVPGIVAGAFLGAVPGVPWLSAGVERSHFAPRCCGNIWWYRHLGFEGGWTDDRRPLGHPLGGHGDEWLARTEATLLSGRVLARVDGYWRDRGEENLFAPTFEGRSTGARAQASAQISPSIRLSLWAEHEAGARDWSRTAGALELLVFF